MHLGQSQWFDHEPALHASDCEDPAIPGKPGEDPDIGSLLYTL